MAGRGPLPAECRLEGVLQGQSPGSMWTSPSDQESPVGACPSLAHPGCLPQPAPSVRCTATSPRSLQEEGGGGLGLVQAVDFIQREEQGNHLPATLDLGTECILEGRFKY